MNCDDASGPPARLLRGRPRKRPLVAGILLWAGAAGLALGGVGLPGTAAGEPQLQASGPYDLTLFHTNDMHGQFLPQPAAWDSQGRMVGGVIALAWHLAEQRRTAAPSIFLDAGDFMTGNPVCNLTEDGVPGAAMARMMTLLGYDAGAFGNHEFDIGAENLAKLATRFGFPLLAMDILGPDGRPALRDEPVVLERAGLKVGVMAVSCADMEDLVTSARMGGLTMGDQAGLVRDRAAALDPATDLIVLITHNGVDGDKELAAALQGAGVDVIVGGHSHTRLREPLVVGGIVIVQAGSRMTDLGRLDLTVRDDQVAGYNGRLVTLWSDSTSAGPELTALAQGYETQVRETFGRRIGTLEVDLDKGKGENLLGNWLADILRERAGADVALINTGGIRKELRAGPLTALDIHEILPFANSLVTVELTDRQLAAVVQRNADAAVDGDHGILQVSGLSYAYRAAADGKSAEVEEILVGGRPLQAGGVYTVALPDYVAGMAHVYLNIEVPPLTDLGVTLTQAVIEAVEEAGTVRAALEGRIRTLD